MTEDKCCGENISRLKGIENANMGGGYSITWSEMALRLHDN